MHQPRYCAGCTDNAAPHAHCSVVTDKWTSLDQVRPDQSPSSYRYRTGTRRAHQNELGVLDVWREPRGVPQPEAHPTGHEQVSDSPYGERRQVPSGTGQGDSTMHSLVSQVSHDRGRQTQEMDAPERSKEGHRDHQAVPAVWCASESSPQGTMRRVLLENEVHEIEAFVSEACGAVCARDTSEGWCVTYRCECGAMAVETPECDAVERAAVDDTLTVPKRFEHLHWR